MNTVCKRIDQSVKFLSQNSYGCRPTGALPLVPISTAEELKAALVKRLSVEFADVQPRLVHQAVNEAHALAALTTVPLLVLPDLAEEKVRQAADWSAHQRELLQNRPIAFAA